MLILHERFGSRSVSDSSINKKYIMYIFISTHVFQVLDFAFSYVELFGGGGGGVIV